MVKFFFSLIVINEDIQHVNTTYVGCGYCDLRMVWDGMGRDGVGWDGRVPMELGSHGGGCTVRTWRMKGATLEGPLI